MAVDSSIDLFFTKIKSCICVGGLQNSTLLCIFTKQNDKFNWLYK